MLRNILYHKHNSLYEYVYDVDVNECESNVCPAHSVCGNTAGSYTCACDPGYKMSNGVCQGKIKLKNKTKSCYYEKNRRKIKRLLFMVFTITCRSNTCVFIVHVD